MNRNKIVPSHPRTIRQYTIGGELGRGSFATVYKAFNTKNRRNYAIKILPKNNLMTPGDTQRFQREINASSFLRHDNIVALHDFFWDEDNFYLVQDICCGGDLFHYITRNDHLEEPVAAFIFLEICSAIKYCHSFEVAHRDLKPENIMIDTFPLVKIADFGLCGFIDKDIKMTTFCGSTAYCSPECIQKVEYEGNLSDIWSLGVILYVMVTGNSPWDPNTAKMVAQIKAADYDLPNSLSDDCRDLISRMIRVDPKERISIEEVLQHPWMALSAESKLKLPPKKKVNQKDLQILPPLDGFSLNEISKVSKLQSTKTEERFGIVSPFEGNTNDVNSNNNNNNNNTSNNIRNNNFNFNNNESSEEESECAGNKDESQKQMKPLPSFAIRSNSFENFFTSPSGRKKVMVPKSQSNRKSLALMKQRCQANMRQTLPPME